MAVASLYAELTDEATRQAIFDDFFEEEQRTERLVLQVANAPQLLDNEPVLRRSITVRNPYVDPMNYMQVGLIRRLRTETDPDVRRKLQQAILLSVNGIAAGLQNTG
jgi:phosphoenolpyruvate carboxylase